MKFESRSESSPFPYRFAVTLDFYRALTCEMPATPDEVLRSTPGKDNFQRVARLLISGGTSLLREIFDHIYPPSNLPTILNNSATKTQLRAANLTQPQWKCLYPSTRAYGKSAEFDVTLLFRLLSTICNLPPPATGWKAPPASTDHSLAADLLRIKDYRNSVYGHVNQAMEITDDEFKPLWQGITKVLVRIAGHISLAKKQEWQSAADAFLKDSLTTEDEWNVQELRKWYINDTDVTESVEKLKTLTQEGMERLETRVECVQKELEAHVTNEKEKSNHQFVQELKNATKKVKSQLGEKAQDIKEEVRAETQNIKCKVSEEAQVTAENVNSVVRKESQDIKEKVHEVRQCMDELRPTAGGELV